MDKKIQTLGQEAFPFIEIKRWKNERVKLEQVPGPSREKVNLESWRLEKEKVLRGQMESVASSVVSEAERSVESVWSEEGLKESMWKIFQRDSTNKMWVFVQLQYLPLLQTQLEIAIYNRQVKGWESRTSDIDRKISLWEKKIPGDFKPSLINVDPRFPVDRCKEVDNRWCDSWLSDALKSKPIPFIPKEVWIEKLMEFYEKVYVPLFQKEEELLAKSKVPPVVKVQEYQETKIPISELMEHNLLGGGSPEEEPLQRNVSRIYKGGVN